MAKCIYDEFDECTYDCENCSQSEIVCAECSCVDGIFFVQNGRTLCFDCFKEEVGEEEYGDFAAEYETEFADFLIKKHAKQRIGTFGDEN